MKTSGDVVPFAPPAGTAWQRTTTGDQLTIEKVENGMVYYSFPTGHQGTFEMPVDQWQDMFKRGKLLRVAVSVNDPLALARRLCDYYLSQGKSLTNFSAWENAKDPLPMEAFDGIEDLVTQALTLDYGVPITDAIRYTGQAMRELEMDKPSEFLARLARREALGFDWSKPEGDMEYRQDWPYDFKWTFNNRTGEPHVWKVTPGGDGRPYHRTMNESQGWEPSDGLAMGQGRFIPPQRNLAGETVEPAQMRVLYYPHTTQRAPEPILRHFEKLFPDATPHEMDYSKRNMYGRHNFEWVSTPENWGNEERIIPQPNGWTPSMPQSVLETFKQRHECPHCEGNTKTADDGNEHCLNCPWRSDLEPNWPHQI